MIWRHRLGKAAKLLTPDSWKNHQTRMLPADVHKKVLLISLKLEFKTQVQFGVRAVTSLIFHRAVRAHHDTPDHKRPIPRTRFTSGQRCKGEHHIWLDAQQVSRELMTITNKYKSFINNFLFKDSHTRSHYQQWVQIATSIILNCKGGRVHSRNVSSNDLPEHQQIHPVKKI